MPLRFPKVWTRQQRETLEALEKKITSDGEFSLYNLSDNSKRLLVAAGSISSGQTRTLTMADVDVDLADLATATAGLAAHISDVANPHATDIENLGAGTLAELNAAISDATLIDTGDARLSDSRAPTNHAAEHTDGTDDIQDATAVQKGLMTAAYGTKLDGIEAAADVTDATNVAAAGAIMAAFYAAKGDLITASADDTPIILSVGADGEVLTAQADGTVGWEAAAGGGGTITKLVYIENPTASDVLPVFYTPAASTISKVVFGVVGGGGTDIDFNLEYRSQLTPDTTSGTQLWTTDEVAGETFEANTTFNDATIPADKWVTYVASAKTGSPTKIYVAIVYTED